MTHPIQDVVQMQFYNGVLKPGGREYIFVCVDWLANGESVVTINVMAPMAAVVRRAALCVRGQLRLDGQLCSPEAYIARWRAVQSVKPEATLDAWFAVNDLMITFQLPTLDAKHESWLSPHYAPARDRLFGPQAQGRCVAELTSTADLLDANQVVYGLAAFGITHQSITNSLRVTRRNSKLQLAASAA